MVVVVLVIARVATRGVEETGEIRPRALQGDEDVRLVHGEEINGVGHAPSGPVTATPDSQKGPQCLEQRHDVRQINDLENGRRVEKCRDVTRVEFTPFSPAGHRRC